MFSFVRRRMYTSALPLVIVLLGVFLLARLTGDPTNADPVCRLSPHHDMIVEAREHDSAGNGDTPLVYRTLRPDGVPGPR